MDFEVSYPPIAKSPSNTDLIPLGVMAMTLRISDELDHRLTEYTAQSGVSKNQFILDAIEEHLDRADQRSATRKSVRRIVERDSALLERLADA